MQLPINFQFIRFVCRIYNVNSKLYVKWQHIHQILFKIFIGPFRNAKRISVKLDDQFTDTDEVFEGFRPIESLYTEIVLQLLDAAITLFWVNPKPLPLPIFQRRSGAVKIIVHLIRRSFDAMYC